MLLVSVPYAALPGLGRDLGDLIKGKIIIDTSNPIVARDGDMAVAAREKGAGIASMEFLPGARIVRAFNAIGAARMAEAAGKSERVGMPIARIFGRSGMKISILGFGCGAVGGLMVRGDPADQERAIGRALDSGVNYFDTAVQYGNGESEKNLGRILNKLKPKDAIVGTKVRLPPDAGPIAEVIAKSLEGSLQRLGLEQVGILHLHNPITSAGGGVTLSARQVLDEVVPAFEALRRQGKVRFLGITATGDTSALHEVIDARVFDSAQVSYNMLNPSAATALPPNYPAQDYGKLFEHTKAAGVGVVGIRVLAGGALSGSAERHPIASPPPEPDRLGQEL